MLCPAVGHVCGRARLDYGPVVVGRAEKLFALLASCVVYESVALGRVAESVALINTRANVIDAGICCLEGALGRIEGGSCWPSDGVKRGRARLSNCRGRNSLII